MRLGLFLRRGEDPDLGRTGVLAACGLATALTPKPARSSRVDKESRGSDYLQAFSVRLQL